MRVTGDYDEDGYALVEGLLAPETCRAFLNRLQTDVEQQGRRLSQLTRQSTLLPRESIEIYGYHYAPMLGLLWGLTPTVAQLLERELLPSYAYFRIYREGDICRVHSDRASCEVSLSLTLDYSDGVLWPLEMGADHVEPGPSIEDDFGGAGFSAVAMKPGDGVLYQGVNRRHGRITPNPNLWSAHLFLHWVTPGGPYADKAFDGNAATTKPPTIRVR